jgi:hypothetical protein
VDAGAARSLAIPLARRSPAPSPRSSGDTVVLLRQTAGFPPTSPSAWALQPNPGRASTHAGTTGGPMPPSTPFPPATARGRVRRSPRAVEAVGPIPRRRSGRFPWSNEHAGRTPPVTRRRRSRRSRGALVLSVALLAATTLTAAPAALARPLDPGPPVPVPRPAAHPADPAPARPGGGGASRPARPPRPGLAAHRGHPPAGQARRPAPAPGGPRRGPGGGLRPRGRPARRRRQAGPPPP